LVFRGRGLQAETDCYSSPANQGCASCPRKGSWRDATPDDFRRKRRQIQAYGLPVRSPYLNPLENHVNICVGWLPSAELPARCAFQGGNDMAAGIEIASMPV